MEESDYTTSPRLRPGQARVQFLANKEKVRELLFKGHSMTEILEILKSKKILTMSYFSFREFVLEYFYNELPKRKQNRVYLRYLNFSKEVDTVNIEDEKSKKITENKYEKPSPLISQEVSQNTSNFKKETFNFDEMIGVDQE